MNELNHFSYCSVCADLRYIRKRERKTRKKVVFFIHVRYIARVRLLHNFNLLFCSFIWFLLVINFLNHFMFLVYIGFCIILCCLAFYIYWCIYEMMLTGFPHLAFHMKMKHNNCKVLVIIWICGVILLWVSMVMKSSPDYIVFW